MSLDTTLCARRPHAALAAAHHVIKRLFSHALGYQMCPPGGLFMRALVALSVLASLIGGPALADTVVGGWTVSTKPNADAACLASRTYQDADDGDKTNTVFFGIVKTPPKNQMILVLGYEGWKFDKGEAVIADLIIDGTTVSKRFKWEGDGTVLTAVFEDSDRMLPIFGAGKKIVLRFGKDGEANFLIPNAGLALGAVQVCAA